MSSFCEQIEVDFKEVMKVCEKECMEMLCMFFVEIKNCEIQDGELVDEKVFMVFIKKVVKQCKEVVEQFYNGGCIEFVEKEEWEFVLFEFYLLQQVDEVIL